MCKLDLNMRKNMNSGNWHPGVQNRELQDRVGFMADVAQTKSLHNVTTHEPSMIALVQQRQGSYPTQEPGPSGVTSMPR
jgi:hypothetical protein